ncbi:MULTISPECIES: NAD-dependent epimerase/dehydratase family protein [unclassified Actinopolyspora]|uniref:NAD-dependent epimerase/dehydratase family protein n=1 Tax=unclassified Actinopolyspora TaxID=2639451 RepID=UPI0013F660C2|nr:MULTISPECIES: NAD-dependent epimerase/dehydratase family protein [unclassified Actinopolyspora]NHD19577.1 NAD-dependent epimerase/dehydratase family protein [Actinopolyspora sp. BKK2]NHE78733.1 NAD-dependent epimerase/dehydratase family protein [Actinopolyspora sp. BKK1]
MSRFVVTGGCGFIGSHLVERLLMQGHEVVVVDAASPPRETRLSQHPGTVKYVNADVRDPEHLAAVAPDEVETIFHLAASVGVDRYLDRPLEVIDTALEGTRNVLQLAELTGAKVVLASTSEIYGKNPQVPWHEDDDRVLGSTSTHRWCYSTSKALAEHVAFAIAHRHGVRATVLRYFNVYGPGQRPAFVISRSVHRALRGNPPVVYDDGGQTRCFTFIDDAVEATLRAASTPGTEGMCLNIGSSRETSVHEAVDTICRLSGHTGAERINTSPSLRSGYQDLRRRVPDTSRAAEVLEWRATTTLEEGLRRTVTWAKENPWWTELPDYGAE